MNRLLIFTFVTLSGFTIYTGTIEKGKASTEIAIGSNATNIARITEDTLVVITGSTYSFTVDTPEDEGLVSTEIGAAQLPLQITSKDGSDQQYKIIN